MMAWPIVSDNPAIQAFYEMCRQKGTPHSMAQIFALRKPPGAKTNRELFRGTGTLADQFRGEEFVLEKLVKKAEQLGRKPHYTDLYVPQLCRPGVGAGDPLAFVPASEGSSHIRRVCEQNNMDCVGVVNVKTPSLDPPKPKAAREPIGKKR